ncbi:hypothetical protein [Francisella adeliensis]|uniref:Uncharacterized protein n=1 Tax=Francisella adeliensis TaxID=2007306 RepID=A0A2Z4Y0A1_9GAMM|nr:hypothetical protein [Francisella adeliensis]AXA34571.1 hypothetical protein CDH04_09265 [Francisella adeliensis]MBK2086295.1 hypothetical protein [Francisella adeliensis]MBK2096511.1 hypothetical protein [Francisella adeliensis]QIW12816.1 hypothetical protein FZC43_09280 [Francisella adeliensis]QIW14693.1 hypothetical protein FZC44_09270 [Francisella adeliensis]
MPHINKYLELEEKEYKVDESIIRSLLDNDSLTTKERIIELSNLVIKKCNPLQNSMEKFKLSYSMNLLDSAVDQKHKCDEALNILKPMVTFLHNEPYTHLNKLVLDEINGLVFKCLDGCNTSLRTILELLVHNKTSSNNGTQKLNLETKIVLTKKRIIQNCINEVILKNKFNFIDMFGMNVHYVNSCYNQICKNYGLKEVFDGFTRPQDYHKIKGILDREIEKSALMDEYQFAKAFQEMFFSLLPNEKYNNETRDEGYEALQATFGNSLPLMLYESNVSNHIDMESRILGLIIYVLKTYGYIAKSEYYCENEKLIVLHENIYQISTISQEDDTLLWMGREVLKPLSLSELMTNLVSNIKILDVMSNYCNHKEIALLNLDCDKIKTLISSYYKTGLTHKRPPPFVLILIAELDYKLPSLEITEYYPSYAQYLYQNKNGNPLYLAAHTMSSRIFHNLVKSNSFKINDLFVSEPSTGKTTMELCLEPTRSKIFLKILIFELLYKKNCRKIIIDLVDKTKQVLKKSFFVLIPTEVANEFFDRITNTNKWISSPINLNFTKAFRWDDYQGYMMQLINKKYSSRIEIISTISDPNHIYFNRTTETRHLADLEDLLKHPIYYIATTNEEDMRWLNNKWDDYFSFNRDPREITFGHKKMPIILFFISNYNFHNPRTQYHLSHNAFVFQVWLSMFNSIQHYRALDLLKDYMHTINKHIYLISDNNQRNRVDSFLKYINNLDGVIGSSV